MCGASAQDRSYLTPGTVSCHDSGGTCYVSGETFNRNFEDDVITDGVRIPGLLANRMGLGEVPRYVKADILKSNISDMIRKQVPIRIVH